MSGPRRLGSDQEDAVADWLAAQGLTIVRRRYKGGAGEIDIVAFEGDVLVAVEVKARKEGDASEAVSRRKLRRMASAIRHFIEQTGLGEPEVRFDVVAVGQGDPVHVRDVLAEADWLRTEDHEPDEELS